MLLIRLNNRMVLTNQMIGAKWFVKAFEHVQSNPEIIKNGFGATGITDASK